MFFQAVEEVAANRAASSRVMMPNAKMRFPSPI
jgi:hypothetical protein